MLFLFSWSFRLWSLGLSWTFFSAEDSPRQLSKDLPTGCVLSSMKNCLSQPSAIWTQPVSGNKDAAQGFPLGWGCVLPISAGKPRRRGEKVCSSWPRTALHKPAQEPFPLAAWPFPRRSCFTVLGYPCTERAGLQASWCSNISWLRLRMAGQKEKINPSAESTTGMETWMDGVLHRFLVKRVPPE